MRWPGKIKAGTVSNEIISHTDWLPTLLAAAGDADISAKLKIRTSRQGEDLSRFILMDTTSCPISPARRRKVRVKGLIYFSDDGDLVGLRYDNWKFVFAEQRMQGTVAIWAEPFRLSLRIPKIFNLRTDPFERADVTSNTYWDWMIDRVYLTYAAQFSRPGVPGNLQGIPASNEGSQLRS